MKISAERSTTAKKNTKEITEMMNTKLEVLLTQTFNSRPLAIVNNLPGLYADFTPEQLRALAAALCAAAQECELQPMDRKYFRKKQRIYDIVVNK